ncbi:MAG: aminotransferase DegT [Bacillota bacterium]|nr:aminotransferase DegT [Bacillota bacterium]
MNHRFIPLSVPNLKGNERNYVNEAIDMEWVSTGGAFIDRFENAVKAYVRSEGAVACQSGTAGLHLSMLLCGVGSDDAVIVPTLTFIAAVNPVRYVGAEPIFMDCDESLCMDPEKLKEYCETCCKFLDGKLIDASGRHIKAVLVVHVFGNLADLEMICDIAEQYHLKVIEDATEALGSYYLSGRFAGKFAGTIGNVGVYSFNGNKIVTSGGGGMIVSQDMELLNHAKHLSTQAKSDDVYYSHDMVGYNYRMTNLQAAVGLAQLEQIEDFIDRKKQNYCCYLEHEINLIPFRKEIRPNYWFYAYLSNNRDKLIQHCTEQNIQVRPVWQLIHTTTPYLNSTNFKIERALYYYDRIVCLPCSSNLCVDDIARVVQIVKEQERLSL